MDKKEISGIDLDQSYQQLFNDIARIISDGKHRVATEVNSTVILIYWSVGKRINDEILQGDRANYGDKIISRISSELTIKFGRGYNKASLFRMVRFAKIYPDQKIVATVSRQLSWSHIVLICQIESEIQRDFYLEIARHSFALMWVKIYLSESNRLRSDFN